VLLLDVSEEGWVGEVPLAAGTAELPLRLLLCFDSFDLVGHTFLLAHQYKIINSKPKHSNLPFISIHFEPKKPFPSSLPQFLLLPSSNTNSHLYVENNTAGFYYPQIIIRLS